MIDNTRDKIEDLKKHLYDVKNKEVNHHLEGVLHQVSYKVPSKWNDDELKKEIEEISSKNKKPKTSIFKKMFFGSLIFFVIALGYGFYMFYSGGSSVTSDKIDIAVLGNAFTKGGVTLPLQVEITNRNSSQLELANIIVEYPSGASDDTTEVTRLSDNFIGYIKSGETVTKNIEVKLYGEEKSVRNVSIILEYGSSGSNSTFTKEIVYPVNISQAPISISVDAPTETVSDQEYVANISINLNTSLSENSDTVLQIVYPSGFEPEEIIPEADYYGDNFWDISDIKVNEPYKITIKGKITGEENEERVFHFYTGTPSSSDKSKLSVVYNSLLQKVTITKPFLEAKIISADSASGGDTISVKIAWANNLSETINDVSISAEISGNAYVDESIISPKGFYDSLNDKITWDQNTTSSLSSVESGEEGTFDFSVKAKDFSDSSQIVSNPNITIKVSISGRKSQAGDFFQDINNTSSKIIKILSDLQIAVSASYYSGNLPPKVGLETKYNIIWTLSNNINSISNAKAVAVLPVYVSFVEAVGSSEDVTYNEYTREVIWNIGQINKYTGLKEEREATFVVSMIPSLSIVGQIPNLIKETKLEGKDNYTLDTITKTRGSITSNLVNDSTHNTGNGKVVE